MKRNKSDNVLLLVQAAMIAALYIVLTLIANAFGLASQAIQVRFSEALTILPYFTPAAIPGLYVGCLLANILTGAALPDIIFGPVATLIGAVLTRKLCCGKTSPKAKWMAPLPPIAANAIIVPPVLLFAYGIRPVWLSFITVTIGEIISCGILGMLLLLALQKHSAKLFYTQKPADGRINP